MIGRWFKTIFAVSVCLGATAMLLIAWQLINKNTPRPILADAMRSPPQQPNGLLISQKDKTAGDIASSAESFIGGVGVVEPKGELIAIGSELAGIVQEVLVKPGDNVTKGTILFQLDRRQALADVAVARSELLAQSAKLTELLAQAEIQRSRVQAAADGVNVAMLNEENAGREFERAKALRSQFAISQEELDIRTLNRDTTKVRTLEAKSKLAEAEGNLRLLADGDNPPSVAVQKAAIAQAEANLLKAETVLELRTVRAPSDGAILSVDVRAGEFVPAATLSSPFLAMGVINPLHIRVDIDETEIPRFRAGAKAYAALRGKPEDMVPLEYVRTEPLVSPKRTLTGSVSERVDTRVMQIIYTVSPEKFPATVGQQVDVYIEELEASL